MIKRLFLAGVLSALVAGTAAAETTYYFGFHIGITNAPPPPKVQVREKPDYVLVAGRDVYMVSNDKLACDMFRVHSYWYMTANGFWYRARSQRGPFKVIDVRRVPRAIFATPAEYWHHHPHGGPPGQMKKKEKSGREHGRDRARVASSGRRR